MPRTRNASLVQPGLGPVDIHSIKGQLPKVVDDLIEERIQMTVDAEIPAQADFMVTTAALRADIERAAARKAATLVVLPEGSDYLRRIINGRAASGLPTAIVIYSKELI